MRRERLLPMAAVAVLLVTTAATAAVPEAISPPTDRHDRPGFVDLRETTVATQDVSGSTVTLTLTSFLVHEHGDVDNVTVVYRAVDTDTGFVETVERVDVGDIDRNGEHEIVGNVTVEREGGYALHTIVYTNGKRLESGKTQVRGIGTLTPEYARTPVAFHRFERADLPAVEYRIQDVENNRTTMQITTHLTNQASTASDGLRLVLKARQADSNIVADSTTIDVGSIEPGRTATPEAALAVPSEYNYYLDAVLWKDGVIVGTTRSVANLDPTETLHANQTSREVGLQVGDFEQTEEADGPGTREQEDRRTVEEETPGFTALVATVALAGVALLARRWSA